MSVYVINFISRWHNLQNLKYLGHGGFVLFLLYLICYLFCFLNLRMIYQCFLVTCFKETKSQCIFYDKKKQPNKTIQYKNASLLQVRNIGIFLTANGHLISSLNVVDFIFCAFFNNTMH